MNDEQVPDNTGTLRVPMPSESLIRHLPVSRGLGFAWGWGLLSLVVLQDKPATLARVGEAALLRSWPRSGGGAIPCSTSCLRALEGEVSLSGETCSLLPTDLTFPYPPIPKAPWRPDTWSSLLHHKQGAQQA